MKFLRLLFLASSLACLASFNAQASEGLSLKKEDLHIKMEQPNLPATKNYEYLEQIKKLKKSQDYAKKTYNPILELNALEKTDYEKALEELKQIIKEYKIALR